MEVAMNVRKAPSLEYQVLTFRSNPASAVGLTKILMAKAAKDWRTLKQELQLNYRRSTCS